MKKYINKITTLCFAALFIVACKKEGDLPSYSASTATVLSLNKTSIAPTPADSNTVILNLSFTDPKLSVDKSRKVYLLEIDSIGRNFAKSYKMLLSPDSLNYSFKAKDLNGILLNSLDFNINVTYDVEFRITTSYDNNNDRKTSNVVKLNVRTYKVPPKVVLPDNGKLYIVGGLNNWNNSNTLDTNKYEFSRINETLFEGIFEFPANQGKNFKLIQELGNWGTQYHAIAGGTSTSGFFKKADADPAFDIGQNSGWYRVIIDFQKGTYKIEPAPERVTMPSNLYLVGGINNWNNSSTLDPKYQFTKTSNFQYTLTLTGLNANSGNYKLIQTLGNWGTQFKKFSGTPEMGELEQKDADPAFDIPSAAGDYKFVCDFATNKYWVTKL